MKKKQKRDGDTPKTSRENISDEMQEKSSVRVTGGTDDDVERFAIALFQTKAARDFGAKWEAHTLVEGAKRLMTPLNVEKEPPTVFHPDTATESQLMLAERMYQYTKDYATIYELFGDLMGIRNEVSVGDRIFCFIMQHAEVLYGICFTDSHLLKVLCSLTKVIDPKDEKAVGRLHYHLKKRVDNLCKKMGITPLKETVKYAIDSSSGGGAVF